MKHHFNRSVFYLAAVDLFWYVAITFLFFSSFYAPILDVLNQAYEAIQENTQSLSATGDPLTSQISLEPHAQLLVTYILFFISLAAAMGIITELIKSKILYKKPFWLKTIVVQVAKSILFVIMLSITVYLLYIQFAIPVIPLWLMVTLISAIWALFFWFIAQSKAKVFVKKKYTTTTLWFAYALVGIFVLLVSFQIIELAFLAGLIWLIGWNWLQVFTTKN